MSEEKVLVFNMGPQETMQGQPISLDSAKLYKYESDAVFAELLLTSHAEKAINAVIISLTECDITGKQIASDEYQFLDLSLTNGGLVGADKLIAMKDNRVRKLFVSIDTVVYEDGTMWKRKECEHTNLREKATDAATKATDGMRKPLIVITAFVLVAVLAFAGIRVFGNKGIGVEAEVGDLITFGHYPQTESGEDNTPIQWLVLAVQGDKALVISRYALDAVPYNTERTDVTWETCTLRKWLNDDFYNKAFSEKEKKNIISSRVSAEENPEDSTDPGNDTTDNVFLLSITEANKYFKDDTSRMCAPTDYAIKSGVWESYREVDGRAYCWWKLRSPGFRSDRAAGVSYGGFVYDYGNEVSSRLLGVRPCVWVRLF